MRMKRLQIKAENVTDQGIFTGHASVFGVVDLDNDVVEPGAFAESIATGTAAAGVLIFGQHDDRKEPLGRSMELREDATGLFVKGQISDTAMGRDYRQLIKDGVLDQMSIGYVAQEYDVDTNNVRHLRKVDLLEISIVNYPANTEAKIESYKGGHTQMKTAKEQTPATKEVKEETGAEGQAVTMTEEQLAQLLEQAAESGATKALKAAADAADDETKDDPAADEAKEDDGKDEEAKAAAPAAKEAKAAPARSTAQRKYAGIYLEDLYVKPSHRGRGYGKALLCELASLAKRQGCGRLEWWCLDWNKPSIDFYLALGAEPMSEWTTYRFEGESLKKMAGMK